MEDNATNSAKGMRILLVDGHGLAYRAFYALPPMNAPDGVPTNAVLGFMNMMLKALSEWCPDGVAIFFDPKGPTERKKMYAAYKEGRRPTPDEFREQMPYIAELSSALGFPVFTRDEVEADDLIASTAAASERDGHDPLILSADKDLFQVLSGRVRMARPTKGVSEFKMYDARGFEDEYGFPPAVMADYLALVGDAVDNIPGVPGIGDKTARGILARCGSLDGVYGSLGILPRGVREKLERGRESAYMSYALVIPRHTEAIPPGGMVMRAADEAEVVRLCERLGLKKLLDRLGPRMNDAAAKTPAESAEIRENVETQDNNERNIPTASASPPEEIFSNRELALCGDPPLLTARDGGWTECGEGVAARLAEWLATGGNNLLLAGYREWCGRIPRLANRPEAILDVDLANYFFHPDARHPLGELDAKELYARWDGFMSDELSGDMLSVAREIDAPLTPVLMDLQSRGLRVDVESLRRLDAELGARIAQIEGEIYRVAGGAINLNSPKQVGELLFERLALPVIKRTKTGYSTDVGVLEELSRLPDPYNELPLKMLEFRECSKMSSGFVQPFIKHASESRDGRVHSTFLHTVTGTARLASRDPNVQNLPVFGDWAVKFRRAIVPSEPDGVFVAADYSQIELRVLAHLSGEERLADAFLRGRDIHLETASLVFDMSPEDITPEQRRFAKTVNFGLIYGMGAHGLASRMGIERGQAAKFVERYFSVLPRVKAYLDRSAKDARAAGHTRSIFGRIRPLAEVSTTEGRGGSSIDRVAVNTPIQSAAADIAKIAMIRLSEALRGDTDTRLVLQVHDSLVCETRERRADEIEALLVRTMEGVCRIDIPLKADPKRDRSLEGV
ncbi:MAG: DNA polymerase I [Synergistaceae bacterium]|jgi:DNA polymerase-1|nr:DNA polymerase I [Synergistaceae bacterium]